jgi:hypothetical protein
MKPAILTALILFFIQMNLPACTAEDREIFTFLSDVQKKLQMKLNHEEVFVQLQNGKAIIVVVQNSAYNNASDEARKEIADEIRDLVTDSAKEKPSIAGLVIVFEKVEKKYLLFTFRERSAPFIYERFGKLFIDTTGRK